MPNRRFAAWKVAAAVAVVAVAFGAGLLVADRGGGSSSPDAAASSAASSETLAEQGAALSSQILGDGAGDPQVLGSASGLVATAEDGSQPATVDVLGLSAGDSATLLTWRLAARGDDIKVPGEAFGATPPTPTSSGTDGVLLQTPDEVVRPLRRIDSTAKACMCSEAPTKVDRDGQVMAALYPPLDQGVDSVDVDVPGFGPVKDVPVSWGGDQPAGAGTEAIPVLGTFALQHNVVQNRPDAFGAVHALRRVPGATVLYLSIGYAGNADDHLSYKLAPESSFDSLNASPRAPFLVDAAGRQEYTTLFDRNGTCLCSPALKRGDAAGATASGAPEAQPYGTLFVQYAILPPLPSAVTAVDVGIGDTVVRDVPVGDGLLAPAAAAGSVALGQGWPAVDLTAVAAAPPAVFPLTSQVSNLTGDVTTVEQPDQVSVELATDVLFAVDSATLTPAAAARIQDAATVLNQRASGAVTIVGHTDDTGTDEHNDQLSLARAQSVLAALQPLVTAPGVTLSAEGHGEREPVADNGTPEGRQANRRVEVTFKPR